MKYTNLVTDEVLENIKRANDACRALHVPTPPVQFIRLSVNDEHGECLEQYFSKSNSWLRNAYNSLASLFLPAQGSSGSSTFGAGSLSVKTTAASTGRSAGYLIGPYNLDFLNVYNSSANANFGILIGTSDAAESFDQYNLQAPIAHGTGAGQMSYAAGTAPVTTYDSGTKKWTSSTRRLFSNSSGSDIVVKEVGFAFNLCWANGVNGNCLMSRDVLASPITVGNGKVLTVDIVTEITFPA
jgi:hypothetical protein